MRLLNDTATRNIFNVLNESDTFENMVWDRIPEYADPEEYFLDKLTDEDVKAIANDVRDIWNNGNFEKSDLDDVMEKYAFQKYGPKNESLKESSFVIKYWASEADRDEGFSETEYIEAKDVEEAISKTREMYYDNSWASCELGKDGDDEVVNPIFGMYPGEKTVEEERFNESVTVTAGSTYVTVDDTGVTVDDNGTSITVDGGAMVNIENTSLVPEEPMGPEEVMEPVEGEIPVENEEPVEETPADDGEEEVIEPSEELIEPEKEEDELTENAGDPNNTVEIYKNPEFDYKINDITELDNVDIGDVRSIDMYNIIGDLEEALKERYGTEYYGLINPFMTRKGKHKKTNESYASALLDISIPKNKKLQELNTVLAVELYGDKALKECVVKDARYNKKIERFCGKTKNPVKFLENVIVDLINNREKIQVTKYQPMREDIKELKEEVSDEAYEIADMIDKRCGDRVQENAKGDKILRRDDFDEEFYFAIRKVYGLKDLDSIWDNGVLPNGEDVFELENTVRGILSYQGWATIFENEDEDDIYEGDLVIRHWDEVNEDVEFMVGKSYKDKGMNFADGKAIEKDVKRQENHIKQHKSLGKSSKKFDVGKEPDQKNTQGKKIEDITDTEKVEDTKKKKKSTKKSSKKKINETYEGNKAFWEKGVKPGTKHNTGVGEVEVLDLDKNANYILGRRKRKDGRDAYVAAWNPEFTDDGRLVWGQGHYFDSDENDNEANAREYFNKKKLGEGVNEEADRIVLKPEENVGFTDPYAEYYKDDNGNLYKSVDNGNELYICTKEGEPLKDVDPAKFILGDQALNEEGPDINKLKAARGREINSIKDNEESKREKFLANIDYVYSKLNPIFDSYMEIGKYLKDEGIVNTEIPVSSYDNQDSLIYANGVQHNFGIISYGEAAFSCYGVKGGGYCGNVGILFTKDGIDLTDEDMDTTRYNDISEVSGRDLDYYLSLSEDAANPEYNNIDKFIDRLNGVVNKYMERFPELEQISESVKLNEAKGLLDDEDDTPEDNSDELVDIDDELDEGATEVAIFHRKPESVEAMKNQEANGITVNKSNYRVIGKKQLSPEEFEDFSKHLSSGKYSWLQDIYNSKGSKDDSGMFNCIEVTSTGDDNTTILVDPNGYDYARFAAIKTDLSETPEDDIEEEPIPEDNPESEA